jgi:DNA-binding protein Fis
LWRLSAYCTHWNKNQAARLLGLNRTTLLEKIKKKGLSPEE